MMSMISTGALLQEKAAFCKAVLVIGVLAFVFDFCCCWLTNRTTGSPTISNIAARTPNILTRKRGDDFLRYIWL